jgi:O-antigen/teichoic acid export membrane protein
VVNTFKTLAIYLPTVLLAPTFAVLANVADNPVAVRNTLRYAIGMAALTVLPLALVVTALAKYALGFIYGAEYFSDGAMLAWAMIVAAIQATGLGLGAFINATGRMWLGLGINLLFGLAFLILAYVLIPKYGPIGYLGAMAIAYLITTVVTYGGFSLTLPHLMQCYPLTRALLLFGVLIFPAVYVDRNFNLPLAVASALLLGGLMAGALAVPLMRWPGRTPSACVLIETPPISLGDA